MPREVVIKIRVQSHYSGDIEREVRLAYAIGLFLRSIGSVERAAERAGEGLYDFLLELRKRGIHAYPYSDEELQEELEIE